MIGLLGGSFDPIHHGHLLAAQVALEQLGLTELRFVVAREQPFKEGRHGASAEHRARMVGVAIAGEPRFRLETLELDRTGPSYTVDTLRTLHVREPGRELVVLLGSDAAKDLDKWREADEVARLSRIVVFGRGGEAVAAASLISAHIVVPVIQISATHIRQRVREGRSIRYWLPDPVAEYIARERLYL